MTSVSSQLSGASSPTEPTPTEQTPTEQTPPEQTPTELVGARRRAPARRKPPTLRRERQLWPRFGGLLAAFDEVGRGALAGPVSVGVVLLASDTKPAPTGVADSKLLTPQARQRLAPRIRRWALDSAVGHAWPAEIDEVGLMVALRLAAERAVAQLSARPDWILLDGNHDYLTNRQSRTPEPTLWEEPLREEPAIAGAAVADGGWSCDVPVVTVVKGDMTCASIAAASVLAKTERDAILVRLAEQHPQYGFDVNKAYSTPFHLHALSRHGPSDVHRRSWNLPLRDLGAESDAAPNAPVRRPMAMTAQASMGDDGQMSIAGVTA